ncbi:hypothetical protein [Scytonema sp. PCC 10023]|uniref:hypothetical protein n=1 Tax=Scytonema sp. PCC 10023 TaxID=1680591 RepID=UPI0039C5BBC1
MLVHIIADYGFGDLAFAEVVQRLKLYLPDAEPILTPKIRGSVVAPKYESQEIKNELRLICYLYRGANATRATLVAWYSCGTILTYDSRNRVWTLRTVKFSPQLMAESAGVLGRTKNQGSFHVGSYPKDGAVLFGDMKALTLNCEASKRV